MGRIPLFAVLTAALLAATAAGDTAVPDGLSLADEPLSLGLSKASVRRARLMVTTDSGPRHFATAFGVPVITRPPTSR